MVTSQNLRFFQSFWRISKIEISRVPKCQKISLRSTKMSERMEITFAENNPQAVFNPCLSATLIPMKFEKL